jgi:hypothetical protein
LGAWPFQAIARLDELVFRRLSECGSARWSAELGEDVAHVPVHGVGAESEPQRDLLIAKPVADEAKNLDFARREIAGARPVAGASKHGARLLRCKGRPDPLEQLERVRGLGSRARIIALRCEDASQ